MDQGGPIVSVGASPNHQSYCQDRGSNALEILAPLILAGVPPLFPPTVLLMSLP